MSSAHPPVESEAAARDAHRLTLALEGNQAWVWDLDVRSGRYWYSDAWKTVLGYAADEIGQDLSDFRRLVHPDDQPMVQARHRAYLAGESPMFEADFRLRAKDGSWIWVQDRGRVVERDRDGRALRAIGVRTDISARKAVETQAQASQAYLTTLIENITDAVLAVGPDGRSGFYNRAFGALFFGEAQGRSEIDLGRIFGACELFDAQGAPIATEQRPIRRIMAGETLRDLGVRARFAATGSLRRLVYNGQPIFGAAGEVELAVLSVHDVTEQHATQEALQASEARFRGVFESGAVGMCLFDSATGQTLAVNDRLLAITGSDRAAFERGDWNWRELTPREQWPRDDAAIRQAVDQGYFEPYEKSYLRPDGSRIDVRMTSAPMPRSPGQLVACVEDISDLKRINEQLRESEGRLEAIIESLEEGVIAVGPSGDVLFTNGSYRRMHGLPDSSAMFRNVSEALDSYEVLDASGRALTPEERKRERLPLDRARPPTEARLRFRDGREIDAVYRTQPVFDDQGRLLLSIAVVRDITEQKRAEADLATLRQELIHVSRVSAMGTMAGSLAHELNQPLAAVANYSAAAQMMLSQSGGATTNIEAVLKRVADEAVRAGEIVNRLRRFITKGEVDRQPESLAAIVREAVAIAHSAATTRPIPVRLKLDRHADRVMADRIQLQQVVFNLVRNAIEAMADRAGAELTIATRLTSAGIELRVADRGPGLPAEVAERLFEPFVTTKESGMGIGLPICRSIVRAHGGDIHAEPGPDGGTVFVVTLPPADAA